MRHPALAYLLAALGSATQVNAQTVSASRGEAVYNHVCVMCHSPKGPATNTLAARLGAERSLLSERRDLAPVYILYVIRNGIGSMPHLTKVEVPDADADAVVAYLTRQTPK